jgi:hypothetical protein
MVPSKELVRVPLWKGASGLSISDAATDVEDDAKPELTAKDSNEEMASQ